MKKKYFINILIVGMLFFTMIKTSYPINGSVLINDNSEIQFPVY